MNLKNKLCNYLIENNLVKEFDVIEHSYSTSRMKDWEKRNVESHNIVPTLTTRCDCLGVVVRDRSMEKDNSFVLKKYKKFIDKNGYVPKMFNPYNCSEIKDVAPTQTTNCGNTASSSTVLVKEKNMNQDKPKVLCGIGEKKSNGGRQWYQQDRVYDDNVAISVTTSYNPYYKNNLRIRKLTPKECWRLMGFADEDYEKAAQVCSPSQLYKQAGNSICVSVLEAIFKQLLCA